MEDPFSFPILLPPMLQSMLLLFSSLKMHIRLSTGKIFKNKIQFVDFTIIYLFYRRNLYNFLTNCRNEEGAFALHVGGEVDVRGTECAVVVAKLTGIVDQKLFCGTSEWILKCQTYEGYC